MVQQAAVTAAAAAVAARASAAGATATALAAAEARPKRVRKLAPSDGWQTAPAAVARRVVEDGQEDAAEDEAVVLEEDLSDEEADSAGPVKWVVPAWEVLAADRGGWRARQTFVRRCGVREAKDTWAQPACTKAKRRRSVDNLQ